MSNRCRSKDLHHLCVVCMHANAKITLPLQSLIMLQILLHTHRCFYGRILCESRESSARCGICTSFCDIEFAVQVSALVPGPRALPMALPQGIRRGQLLGNQQQLRCMMTAMEAAAGISSHHSSQLQYQSGRLSTWTPDPWKTSQGSLVWRYPTYLSVYEMAATCIMGRLQ